MIQTLLHQRMAWLTLVLAIAIAFPTSAHINDKSDSGIEGPAYQTIAAELDRLEAAHPNMAKVIRYGQSHRGKELRMLRIQLGSATPSQRPAVLITGATHGNEYLNIVDRMPKWILTQWQSWNGLSDYLLKGGVIYLVPILNPDGYDRDRRGNAQGNDLNRDFDLIPTGQKGFTQPETKTLVEALERDLSADSLKLKIAMDYHCCIGAWLYPWSYTSRITLPRSELADHKKIPQEGVRDGFSGYRFGTTPEILGYKPRGTSKDFYYARFGALAFTFEGKRRTESQNFSSHQKMWDRVLGGIAQQED